VEETPDGGASGKPAVVSEAACKKACPADPEPPPSAIEECRSGRDPSGAGCDAHYVASLNCASALIVCRDGKTDANASTTAIFERCAADLFGYQTCLLKGLDGGLGIPDARR